MTTSAETSPAASAMPAPPPEPADHPMIDTLMEGPGLGRFALPMSTMEAVLSLSNGVACQVPAAGKAALLDQVAECFDAFDGRIEWNRNIVQVTPRIAGLSAAGTKKLGAFLAKNAARVQFHRPSTEPKKAT